MAVCPDVPAAPGAVVGSVLLLVLVSNPVWGNYTTLASNTNSTNPYDNTAVIVAPVVTFGVLAIILAVLGCWLFRVVKKKRQTEGTYRPSAEEQSGVRSVAVPDALKLPKEERLI